MNGGPFGCAQYHADHETDFGRLFVAVTCFVGGNQDPLLALLDMAGEWCMMPAEFAVDLGYEPRPGGDTRIHTRFGLVTGRLEVVAVEFRSEAEPPPGAALRDLAIDATWFISEEWPGPAVIG